MKYACLSKCFSIFVISVFVFLTDISSNFCVAESVEENSPNIVILLADDLGWGDLSCNGGAALTPEIDRLFESGCRMESFTTCPVCSPTRGELLTGRHSLRLGAGPQTGGELALEETTIAEAFRGFGYATGIFGKWHNGKDPATPEFIAHYKEIYPVRSTYTGGFGVNAHGFDEAWVYYGGGNDYFDRTTVQGYGPVSWWHNREFRKDDRGYTDDFVCDRAVDFIRANQSRPFFCYVPFHVVHEPLQAKEEELAQIPDSVTDPQKRAYYAMLRGIDGRVERILDTLEELHLAENTIVVFFSDNGPTRVGSALPHRGGKHTLFEGGVRSPAVIRWPRGGLDGGTYGEVWGCADLFPTLVAMSGNEMPPTRPLDGKNVWPAIRDHAPSPVRSLYWVWTNYESVRMNRWKLYRYFDRTELYDLSSDISETRNVADRNPEIVRQMTREADRWRKSTGVALSSQPPELENMAPRPEGTVLEIQGTLTSRKIKPEDWCLIPLHQGGDVRPGDYLEYDVCVLEDSELEGGFGCFSFKKNRPTCMQRGTGIDQFGRELQKLPPVREGKGVWEHRVYGIGTEAPTALGAAAIALGGNKTGRFHLLFDNIQIRNSDGTVRALWNEAETLRIPKNKMPAEVDNLQIIRTDI